MNDTLRSASLGLCLGLSIICFLENASRSRSSAGFAESRVSLTTKTESNSQNYVYQCQADLASSILGPRNESFPFTNKLDSIRNTEFIPSKSFFTTGLDPLADYQYTGTVNTIEGVSGLVENSQSKQGWYVKEGETWLGFPIVSVTNDAVTLLVNGKPRTLGKSNTINIVQLAYASANVSANNSANVSATADTGLFADQVGSTDSGPLADTVSTTDTGQLTDTLTSTDTAHQIQRDTEAQGLYVQDMNTAINSTAVLSLDSTNTAEGSDGAARVEQLNFTSDASLDDTTIVELGERVTAESERLSQIIDIDESMVRSIVVPSEGS